MNDCIFCKIINREIPASIISEDDSVIVFLSLENHPLIIPKTHIKDIYELDSSSGHALIDKVTTVARAVKASLNTDGIYVTQANETAGGQDVFHIHFHIYPRWKDAKLNEKEMTEDELTSKIKAALASEGA